MNELKAAVTGDTGDRRILDLGDLTGATAVEAHVWRNGVTPEVLAAEINVDGTVSVDLGPWLADAAPTSWLFEVDVTFPQGSVTWPSSSPAQIVVRANGDP